MARIEELLDDADELLEPHLGLSTATPSMAKAPENSPTVASPSVPFPIRPRARDENNTTPALPPHMESVRSYTADEVVQMMNKTPLFMTSLEDADDENIELEAIRALQYEGSRAENAEGFKNQGNEMAKLKRWKDGKEFYTKGIALLSPKSNLSGPQEVTVSSEDELSMADQEVEHRKERELEEACYVNRALCNLELKNYRSTTSDCASALRLNPKNVKAYYRSSIALLALDKILEATDCSTRGLTIDPANTALKTLSVKIKARGGSLTAVQQKKKQKAERAQKEKVILATALRARNIRTRSTAQPPDLEDASIHLSPDPLSPTSALQFPVVLLYPLHAQSDFIKAVAETDSITQHLEYIFPLPWDEKNEYSIRGVELYMETRSGGLIKVGKKMSLLKVFGSGDVEIVDSIVKVNVVIKEAAAAWIEEMKIRKGKQRTGAVVS